MPQARRRAYTNTSLLMPAGPSSYPWLHVQHSWPSLKKYSEQNGTILPRLPSDQIRSGLGITPKRSPRTEFFESPVRDHRNCECSSRRTLGLNYPVLTQRFVSNDQACVYLWHQDIVISPSHTRIVVASIATSRIAVPCPGTPKWVRV